jgi:hypothetical protein
VDSEHHSSKRRRVEAPQGSPSPNMVSRSESNADSSSRLRTAGYRQDPVCNQSRITIHETAKAH